MKSEIKEEAEIRSYTIKELASLYGCSIPTMSKWIKEQVIEAGRKNERLLTIRQVEMIFSKLGRPNKQD